MHRLLLTVFSLLIAVIAFAATPPLGNPIPLTPPAFGEAAPEQWLPAVVLVGSVPVTAWIDHSEEVSTIRLARVGGTPLTVAEARFQPTAAVGGSTRGWLDVFYDGATVWVAWFGEDKQLGVRRYTPDLVPIDAAPRMFAPPEKATRVLAGAAGDGALTVIFHRLTSSMALPLLLVEPVASVFRAEGDSIVKLSEISLKTDTEQVTAAGVVWDGQFFFVAWRQTSVFVGDPPLPYPTRIRAAHITSDGKRLGRAFLPLYDTPDYAADLFVEASPDGVVLAWSQTDGVRVARYPSDVMPLQPTLIPMPYSGQRHLAAIVPIFTGEVDVYWWTGDHPFHNTLRYERLSPSLQSTGDVHVTPLFESKDNLVQLDATAVGVMPVVVHTQLDRNPAVGGVTRLFVRQGQIRRRAVR